MKKVYYFSVLLLSLVWAACDDETVNPDGFNRTAMLTHMADHIIMPGYDSLVADVQVLSEAVAALGSQPSESRLVKVRSAWQKAYTSYLNVQAFNFGPAGEEGITKVLTEEIGTFPVSEAKINGYIAANDTSFNNFDRDSRGFLAIEYLIFGKNTDSLYQASHLAYLKALTFNVAKRVGAVQMAWKNGYRTTFIERNGTDIGSSTSQLYNEFIKAYELVKNYKLGLPLGKRIGQTQPEPQKVEGYYSGLSLTFLKVHFEAIIRIWEGKSSHSTAQNGFKAYLATVEGGNALVQNTEAQIDVIRRALAAVPNTPSVSAQITANPLPLETLYNEMQKHTRFFKSDLSSLIGIAITFASGDGD